MYVKRGVLAVVAEQLTNVGRSPGPAATTLSTADREQAVALATIHEHGDQIVAPLLVRSFISIPLC